MSNSHRNLSYEYSDSIKDKLWIAQKDCIKYTTTYRYNCTQVFQNSNDLSTSCKITAAAANFNLLATAK